MVDLTKTVIATIYDVFGLWAVPLTVLLVGASSLITLHLNKNDRRVRDLWRKNR